VSILIGIHSVLHKNPIMLPKIHLVKPENAFRSVVFQLWFEMVKY
jgi:hypothetical protein